MSGEDRRGAARGEGDGGLGAERAEHVAVEVEPRELGQRGADGGQQLAGAAALEQRHERVGARRVEEGGGAGRRAALEGGRELLRGRGAGGAQQARA